MIGRLLKLCKRAMDEQAPVFNVTPEGFQTEVIDRSQQLPVLLLFWADQVPPSVETRRQLEGLVGQYQGKVLLGLVDVAQDQTLAQHLRVQGLPSIRVVKDGQLVDEFTGALPEAELLPAAIARAAALADKAKPALARLKADLYPEVLAALAAPMDGLPSQEKRHD